MKATTVKKPSKNSPIKQASRRRCERKQTPQNRVIATKGRRCKKTVEDARLPTEQEKVAFFDSLGIDRRRLPRRLYHGANGNQTRYFALKLPIAANAKTATFAYVDPGRYTDTELRSWGAAHEWLWRALRGKGVQVQVAVIGADYTATIRAEAALKTWSSRAGEQSSQREYGPSRNDPEVKAEIQHTENALLTVDRATIARYDGVKGITKRLRELKDLPKPSGPGATIDGCETWVSDRLRMQDSDL